MWNIGYITRRGLDLMHNIPEGASYLSAVHSFALCKAAV